MNNEELAFNNALMNRLRTWREEKNWTAAQMATALGIPADRYRKYETRSVLPPYLFERVCLICDASFENLILGTPRKPSRPYILVENGNITKNSA